MQIAYAAVSRIPSRFANSINVMKMCQGFKRLGHAVDVYFPGTIACAEFGDPFAFYGIAERFPIKGLVAPYYPSWPGRISFAYNFARNLHRQMLAYGRDWPALALSIKRGRQAILELHAPPPDDGIKRHVFRILMNSPRLRRIVVNSTALFEEVAQAFPRARQNLLLARNGADPIRADGSRPTPVKRRGGRMMVGYTGHLYAGRGLELLPDLATLCPWADFHIVGGWREDVEIWRQRLGAYDNVFLHGYVPPALVPDFILAFDVMIAPYQPTIGLHGGAGDNSRWVCPLKVFEYMAAGKPIISSNHAVIREVLSHERNALLCPPTEATVWAYTLDQLRTSPALAAKIGAQAQNDFNRNYSWDARAKAVLEGISDTQR